VLKNTLKKEDFPDEKWKNYSDIRLPQTLTQIETKRDSYKLLMDRREEKISNKNDKQLEF
jgi:hypothetical protein